MNAIPTDAMPYLEFLLLLTVASLVVLFLMSLREIRGVSRWRAHLRCPVRLRAARVEFRISGDGTPAEVLHCSIFGRRPITCGKACAPHAA